jgi:ribosomal protein L7/L12
VPVLFRQGEQRGKGLPHCGQPDPFTDSFPDVAVLVRDGRKIDAIKLLRERTGWDLKEAKDFVGRLASQSG